MRFSNECLGLESLGAAWSLLYIRHERWDDGNVDSSDYS